MGKISTRDARIRRHRRVRAKLTGTESEPRLCVFRSLTHIYAQIIDDTRGNTLVTAATTDPEIRKETDGKAKTARAGLVGVLVAQRALAKGVKQVVFDRGGYQYHGRVKALAEAARGAGLKF